MNNKLIAYDIDFNQYDISRLPIMNQYADDYIDIDNRVKFESI